MPPPYQIPDSVPKRYNTRLVFKEHPGVAPALDQPWQNALARRGLAGFFLSGLLLAFLGAILPAWGYHIRENFLTVGNFFLSMNLGLMASAGVGHYGLARKSTPVMLVTACGIACGSLLGLALLPPGLADWWRLLGIFALGLGAGLLHRGVFRAISELYRRDPAATIYQAGIFFGAGSVVVSLLVAGTYYVYTVASILVWIALIPGLFLGMYAKMLKSAPPEPPPTVLGTTSWRETLAGLKSPAAVLLALLLFFQFGNEWSLAGWLPLLLTKRVGVSPASALLMLTLYWLALVVGRIVAAAWLPRMSHGKLLGASVLAALLGCLVLAATNNRFGAVSGILLVGGGFASVYPLAVERIGGRFPSYHPGFFNGIFSFAVTGGLLAPWSLGFFVEQWGAGAVIAIPLLGTLMVFVLLVLLWAEAKLAAQLT